MWQQWISTFEKTHSPFLLCRFTTFFFISILFIGMISNTYGLSQHWKRLGSILDNNSSHMFTVISRFHKKKLASKASKLKTPPPTRATRKDLQLPAARILKLNCPKKKNSSLQRWNWVPLAQGRSCLSLCNQHLYWPVRNPEARKQLLRTIQRAAG